MRVARGPVEDDGTDPAGRVVVDDTQRRRSRFRTATKTGEDIGVVVDSAPVLSSGDLLETDDGERFVVELDAVEALVVEFSHEHDPAAMVVAGHAVGNRHWDLVAHDGRVYVPTGGDAEGRRAFLQPFLPSDATVTVEFVEPTLFDDREHGEHRFDHGDGHAHDDGHSHPHSHPHAHGPEADTDETNDVHGAHSAHDTHDHAEPTTMTRDQLRRRAREATSDE